MKTEVLLAANKSNSNDYRRGESFPSKETCFTINGKIALYYKPFLGICRCVSWNLVCADILCAFYIHFLPRSQLVNYRESAFSDFSDFSIESASTHSYFLYFIYFA